MFGWSEIDLDDCRPKMAVRRRRICPLRSSCRCAMKTLVAIPVFNEERYLRRVLSEVSRFARDVLVIDDGSTDATPVLLRESQPLAVIRHSTNMGYGRSLIDAFSFAAERGYDWVITMDCDDQHEPARIPDFLAAARRGNADIVSGSRYLTTFDANDRPPADRRRINATITWILNTTLGLGLTDAFCGFKAHRVSSMARMQLDVPGYAFPLQFWVQAAALGLRVAELPVRLIYQDQNRHFGGMLDDADVRLRHYLDVFDHELARADWSRRALTHVSCGGRVRQSC